MRRTTILVLVLSLSVGSVPLLAGERFDLPFGRSMAGDRDLPRPLGIGLTLYSQSQEFAVDSLFFDVPNITIDPNTDLAIDNKITEYNLKIDFWLLPFLNIFGIFGEIEGKTKVVIVVREMGPGRDAPLGITTVYMPITPEEEAEIERIDAEAEDV